MEQVELDPYLDSITTALQCSKCEMIYYARKLWKLDHTGNFVRKVDC